MESFPITETSLNTTIIEYLTREISYLNRKNDNLFKLLNTMQSNLNYASDFIKNTYDLSGNFVANMKVVAFDSSNNIISYACTDASGSFIPSVNHDISMVLDVSNNLFHNDKVLLKNTMVPTEEHIRDIDDDDIDRRFNWGFHHHRHRPYFPFYPHPYYPYYPYPYPYPLLNNDDDYYNRDISLNHPPLPMPNYPMSEPQYKPPVIHRDVLNNMIDIDGSNELNKSIENYYLNPMHHSANNKQNQKPNNPLHRYTKKMM